MRKFKGKVFSLFFVAVTAILQDTEGQAISSDTIYVNTEAEVAIKFPSKLNDFYTTPNNAPYNLKSLSSGLTISAKTENTKPALLFVTEGGRTHHLVIAFKKNINYDNENELFLDYSTLKKLELHVNELAKRKQAPPSPQPSLQPLESKNVNKEEVVKSDPVGDSGATSNNYYALLEEGDKNLQRGLYKEAKVVFENAHNIRPNDAIPVQRLEEIRLKTSDKETLAEVELNEKYIVLTATAKTNLDQKQYKEAQDKYKQALLLKPNDLYVNHQLEKIDLLLKEEREKRERLKLQELYRTYMADGEKALKQNKLTEARISFEQALVITPNDPLAKNRIATIDSKEKELVKNDAVESDYNTLINDADKAFQAGDYTTGKALYNKALTLTKQPWPKDQISHINKLEADRAAKEAADKLALQQKEATDKKEKEDQALENSYYTAVQTADKLYKDGRLADAKTAYAKAMQIMNRPWPRQQIIKIETLIAEQDLKDKSEKQKLAIKLEKERRDSEALSLETRYNVAIKTADDLFNSGKYADAKTAYIAAMSIITKPWPEEQLKKINKKEADIAAAEKAESLKVALQKGVDEKYDVAIQAADLELSNKNYLKAKRLYMEAALIKPGEARSKEGLSNVQSVLVAEEKEKKLVSTADAELNKKYTIAISKAQSYYLKEDLANAQAAYTTAAALKPMEVEPQTQLKLINQKLEELARLNEINTSYENKIAEADSLLIRKNYGLALQGYQDALAIKAEESYPALQIKYIQGETNYQQKLKEEREKLEAHNTQVEKRKQYRKLVNLGDKSVIDKNFEVAKKYYTDALILQPEDTYAIQRLKIVNYQLELLKSAYPETPMLKSNEPAKPETSSETYQKQISSNGINKN